MGEKIFIELDDEIIFVIEKLKKASKERVILIVPEKAALLGSVVSLKLLAREIAKTDKLSVLVTEDEVGAKLAKKADLVSVSKVGEINDEIWERASDLKGKLGKLRDDRRKKLLKERKENTDEDREEKIEAEKSVSEEPDKEAKEEAERPPSPPADLKKLDPEEVEVDGFRMVAGGDIAEIGGTADVKSGSKSGTLPKSKDDKGMVESSKKDEKKDRDLTRVDYSAMYSKKKSEKEKGEEGESKLAFLSDVQKAIGSFLSKGGMQRNILIGISVFLVVFLLLSYFVLPSAAVIVKVESEDVDLEEEVIADTNATSLNAKKLTIPAEYIEVTKDRSETANATGKKETGEEASGQVTIFNLTESQVKLPSGTTIEAIETGKKYKTNTAVTITAKKPDDDPQNPGLIGNVDVGVTADKFGKDYNVEKKLEFRVVGYDIEKLYGKNFTNITGGTTEEIKVVSQEDYNKVKEKLVNSIKQDLNKALKEEAGSEKTVLENTIKYDVLNDTSSPSVDSEAETFNVSVTVKGKALSFSKDDIDSLANKLFEKESKYNVDIEEFEYDSKVIKTEGSKVYINLEITGLVTPSIDGEEISNSLVKMNKDDAAGFLEEKEQIKEYEIDLSPKWLPSFLRHFPSSPARIDVRVEKVEK